MSQKPVVQWSFLQYKKSYKGGATPAPCFLQSTTQIGSKLLVYGGCDAGGEALNQLFLYDTETFLWSSPSDAVEYQEDHPGGRYGHTSTLVEMHPPKIMIYGGMISGKTFEFDIPDSVETSGESNMTQRSFMSWRRKGKNSSQAGEEADDAVYFLTLHADKWVWSKPMVHGSKETKPVARAEHAAARTGTNEVTIFGGWSGDHALNDLWTFNFVDMEWQPVSTSGIQPRPRYRHTMEVIGNRLFILGGSDNIDDIAETSSAHLATIHELDLATMQWRQLSVSGVNPFPRSGHASAVIGARSIAIFGGKKNNTVTLQDPSPLLLSIYAD